MKKKHMLSLTAGLAAAVLLAGCAPAASSSLPAASASQGQVGSVSPSSAATVAGILSAFTAPTLDGGQADATLWENSSLTMVNAWATYCGPCLREMPELAQLSESYADKGVQVVGIVVDVAPQKDGTYTDASLQTARDLVDQTGAAYVHLLPSADLDAAFLHQVSAVPTTIFVDSAGNQVGETYVGSRSGEDWAAIIDTLLAQQPTA
jgi:thiol-disulfide isomerase/thioredoxin